MSMFRVTNRFPAKTLRAVDEIAEAKFHGRKAEAWRAIVEAGIAQYVNPASGPKHGVAGSVSEEVLDALLDRFEVLLKATTESLALNRRLAGRVDNELVVLARKDRDAILEHLYSTAEV